MPLRVAGKTVFKPRLFANWEGDVFLREYTIVFLFSCSIFIKRFPNFTDICDLIFERTVTWTRIMCQRDVRMVQRKQIHRVGLHRNIFYLSSESHIRCYCNDSRF